METVEHSIEVNAPVEKVYNQWTQFEEFPEFMEGVEEVRQLDDKRLHWIAKIAGKREEWDAEIFEQIPDQRIAWRAISGKQNMGAISFDKITGNQTRVRAVISFEPEGMMEKMGGALGLVSARIKGDLNRFKEFIESRSHETGAWRGEVKGAQVSRETGAAARSKRLHTENPQGTSGSTI